MLEKIGLLAVYCVFSYIIKDAALLSCIIGICTVCASKGHIGLPALPNSGHG